MSKKDYKQGMADAMGAYEAFGEKQEAAIRYVGAEIEKTAGKVDKLAGRSARSRTTSPTRKKPRCMS